MILMSNITICMFLCFITITKSQSDPAPKEDLQDEYYTIAATFTDKFQPSDDRDAQAVLDSDKDAKVMASIFVYREKIRRNAINKKIWEKNEIIVEHTIGLQARRIRRRYWISEGYTPQCQRVLTDLIFSLIYDENVVLAEYIFNFFNDKLPKRITIAMVLTKDTLGMIATYDRINNDGKFKYARENLKSPYENMLRVWVRQNREPLEKDDPPPEAVKQNAEALKTEQDKGGWHEDRDQIELILMKKSIKFARAVIIEFEKLNNGKQIEDILNENINKCKLDENLADAYASLACYIKNKHKYIAGIMAKYSDGLDQWAAWILCIAVVHPQEWSQIDEVFKKDQKGVSLSKFIVEKITDFKELAEALAVVVDSKFKPTTFTERPIDNSPIPPSPPPPPTNPSAL